ncbi:hypothetical protein GCK72_001235 [Caenorhabditis remanei]|uniref:Uncharacterized protein n=1 Tax=Caenorhabditis remanei TaxID=31234 RepID=A0A6A5HND0_CAERE|nr:hypothetical protein GCK72_001235 [Caenorhabditis remanei]KAF1769418.1 hypothetical protein GCK72_001235 [Caenorhabditis remanei]
MEEKEKSKTEEDIPDKKTPESPALPQPEKEDSKKSSKKEDSKKENEKQNPESSTTVSPFLLKINPEKLIYSSFETMEISINNPTDKEIFVILHFDSFFFSLKSEDLKLFEMQENDTCHAKKGYKIMKPNESIVLKIEQMKHDDKTSPNEFYNYKTPEGYLEIFHQEKELVPPEFMKITTFDDFSDKLNYEKWAVRKEEIELKELTESLRLLKEKFNESKMNKSKKGEPKAKKEVETVSYIQRKKAREEKEKQEKEEERMREKEEREREREERRIERIKEIKEKEKERDEYDRKVERMKQMVIKQEQWQNEKNNDHSKITTQNSSKKEKKTIKEPPPPQQKSHLSARKTFNGGTDDEKKDEEKKEEEKKKKKNPCCTIL